MDLEIRPEEAGEEPESEDVIHVQVRQQDVDPLQLGRHRRAEYANAGAGVEHHERAWFFTAHLHARCVATVALRRRARSGYRPSGPPDTDVHGRSSQNSATAPSSRSFWPMSGNAVTERTCRTPVSAVMKNRSCAGRPSRRAMARGRLSGASWLPSPSVGTKTVDHSCIGISPVSS